MSSSEAVATSSTTSQTGSEALLNITVKGPSDTKLLVSVSAASSVADLKLLVADALVAAGSDRIEPAQQRLIYSGRVLKDEEVVVKYGLKDGNVVHLVKGSKPPPPAAGSSSAVQGVPANFQAGNQVMGNPLAPLMNAQNAGALGGFNPFAEMGVNTNDPNYMAAMMNSPEAQANVANMLNNPAVIDQLIASNPELQRMGPQVREIMQSEQFRSMLSNPEAMRNMMQMQQAMRGAGAGRGAGGAPGAPAGGALFNPWGSEPPAGAAGSDDALGRMMAMMGPPGGSGGAAPDAGPVISPEERFQVQLGQLNEMGFWDAAKNIRALMATGGNTQAAIEYLFSMP